MDYTLTEDQEQLRRLVEDFVARDVKPYWEKHGYEDFPWPLFRKLGELGLAAIPFPAEFGGGGLDYSAYITVLEELSRLGSHLGSVLSVHGLPQLIINHFGTLTQKQKYLPAMARVTEKGKGAKGVSSFIVEKGTPGLAFGKRERPMGLPHHTREVFFEDCEIARGNLIGREGEGFKVAMTALDSGRITVAATSIGTAQQAFDHALRYSTERKAFGQTISSFQGIQFMLADMAAGIEAARLVMKKAAWLRDRGLPFNIEASMAKLLATDCSMKVTTDAVQIYGGYGTSEDYPVQALMREAKIGQIVEGTNQIQRMIIARELLKKFKQ